MPRRTEQLDRARRLLLPRVSSSAAGRARQVLLDGVHPGRSRGTGWSALSPAGQDRAKVSRTQRCAAGRVYRRTEETPRD